MDTPIKNDQRKRKIAILYTFHVLKPPIERFIQRAIFESDEYKFILIPCGISITHLNIPRYVQIFNRPNIGYDFGAWSDVILLPGFVDTYTHVICINSSVTGPFTPPYYCGKWPDIFINPLNDQLRLFGCTISDKYQTHVHVYIQTYVFSLEISTLQHLINRGIFSPAYTRTMNDTIVYREIEMSCEIIRAGWNIGCLMKYYEGIDWRDPDSTKRVTAIGNVCSAGKYFGNNIHPYEVVFLKHKSDFSTTWLAIYETELKCAP
jgi:hypothetical protein